MIRQFKTRPRAWIMPTMLILGIMSVVVMGYSIYLALHDINLVKSAKSFVGADNFVALLQDSRAWSSLWRTIVFSISATGIELLLGLGLALYLNRPFIGRKLVRTLLLIPMIMTPVVSGLIWRVFYDPNSGVINYYLGQLGLSSKINWLGSTELAMVSVIVADVWQWTPFVFLILAAGLDAMPSEPLEAAEVDGASTFQRFSHVVLPLLAPSLIIAFLLRIIDSVKTFDIIYVMTRGGPSLATETTNMYAYIQGFNNFNISYATVINLTITVIITFIFTTVYTRLTKAKR
ncbi:carbohydrate ABC transporter permease [Paenibacillus nasutitermitis]|uniref:Sugar ABC transporter permease n=1 Tax=Paenibacillus nasutitermitis TaxID=1652958 RepID=A0A916YSM8_9BACL|nr:sugar ABC transporter permease [Paenibacillus nasutitermitis]GGD59279.1 sugar ABC transporter permease [Paenibacillus nasutitermitis]